MPNNKILRRSAAGAWVTVIDGDDYLTAAVDGPKLPPAGGTTGQVLTKKSATNYDTEWKSTTAPTSGGFTFVQDTAPTPLKAGDTWFDLSDAASGGTSWVAISEVPGSAGPLNWVQFAPGSGLGNGPRGQISRAANGSSVPCPASSLTYLTAAIPWTAQVGRLYRIEWSFRAVGRTDASDSPAMSNLQGYDGTTPWTVIDHWFIFRGQWNTMTGFIYVVGDGVTRSTRVGVNPPVALTIFPTYLGIEDIGAG